MPYRIKEIDPKTTALIVVDGQNTFVGQGGVLRSRQFREALPKIDTAVKLARGRGMRVIYAEHVHQADGPDSGAANDLYSTVAKFAALVNGSPGVGTFESIGALRDLLSSIAGHDGSTGDLGSIAPQPGDHTVKKFRYSAFFGTHLDSVLRGWGITQVAICGATTEGCCLSTARDAMSLGYQVGFLADASGTFDCADVGQGAHPAEVIHATTLGIIANTTGHVMTVDEFADLVNGEGWVAY